MLTVTLSVTQKILMLSVIMLNVVMLSVMVPESRLETYLMLDCKYVETIFYDKTTYCKPSKVKINTTARINNHRCLKHELNIPEKVLLMLDCL
jgi:hypothetical protein